MLTRGPRSGLESIFQIFLCLRVYGEGSQKSSGAQACLMGPFFGGGGGGVGLAGNSARSSERSFCSFRLQASRIGCGVPDVGPWTGPAFCRMSANRFRLVTPQPSGQFLESRRTLAACTAAAL